MSRLNNAFNNDLRALLLIRDELGLQLALLKADMKTRYDELEGDLAVLREHLMRARVAAGDSKDEIEKSVTSLVGSLLRGYRSIKDALTG